MTRPEAEALAAQLAGEERVGGTDVRHAYPEAQTKDPLYRADAYVVAFEVLGSTGHASQWWLVESAEAARELLAP